ncbi:hypothetical protein EB796_018562 [Bugula neritina]|uniref:Uncharacterized protein n=1 Tax=Bugula neritina TaxID=10212 RepID=A0A7J7JA86_BUGNE|nr:hypothetical protein EB796_018562 [Bugula neritina]
MWALITLLCLDDLSFLVIRVVCIFGYKVTSYSSYFFMGKNLLVLCLDVNRIIALHKENRKELENRPSSRRLSRIRR